MYRGSLLRAEVLQSAAEIQQEKLARSGNEEPRYSLSVCASV